MSKSKENVLTKMYGGKFADQVVYRNRDGVSIMSKVPKKSPKEVSESRLKFRRKFKMATRWAKQALEDPAIYAEYAAIAKGMNSPYTMAIKNYLCPPEVREIISSDYSGEPGSKIIVNAVDDFKLTEVKVKITDASGTLIEQGPCVEDISADCWVYTATVPVADLTGVVITAIATDIPNHAVELAITL